MEKNSKQLLSEYCQRQKIPNPLYECTPDKDGQPNGFFCTLKVGDESFTIPAYEKSKKAAEMIAANMACSQMNITQSSVETKKVKSTEIVAAVEPDEPTVKAVKEPDWITIEKVEDIYKYLTDEVLAQEFKAFLHCKAQEEKKGYPLFTVTEATPGGKRYIATVVYDDVTYSSIGSMMTKKQAEQSAAEACLRTLGDFPNVSKDKYTIQQNSGGQGTQKQAKVPHKNMPQKQQRPMYRLLCQLTANLKLQYPFTMHKVDSSGEIPLYTVALQSEGKRFQSTTPATTVVEAAEEASIEALKYLGIANPEEANTLKESISINIRNRSNYYPMTPFASPLSFCPSKRTGWVFQHFESVSEMTGKEFVKGDDKKNIIKIRPSETQDVNQIFDRAMKVEPSIDGTPLSGCDDIVVAEVSSSNKSNAIVGNQDLSIPMFAENGKILSTKKGSLVDLLPGQNIHGLKCSYQLMYPSLQVYLKAESCTEVTKPRKPLPVVTSCGVAMLIYDHEAHVQDLNILLTRPSGKLTFVSKANYFKSYLNGAITSADTSSTFTVAECVKNITTWTAKEVRLMSEMTVESMKELLSVSVRYDERWGELFGEKQTDVLKELKGAAVAELSRRKTAGVVDGVEEEWRLPTTTFQHTFNHLGIHMEKTVRCAFRSAVQLTGMKVKLADLEESRIVDVPVNNANKGAVCRYYVWKGIRRVSGDEKDPYYKAPTDVTAELGEGWVVKDSQPRGPPRGNGKRFDNRPPWYKKRRFHDNDTGNGASEPKKGNTELDEDIAEVPEPVDEDVKVPTKPGVTSFNKPIHMECRWVALEEAKKICPILKTIANETPFKNQVIALQLDANNFWKERQEKQEAV